ncbi:creatininase family protein [Paenibacillus sacheonensis]|uniref:Creatininase family protein n=1 Tax=Paenibacillus sacheonensis TaxID=742054 RepID=A0A7X4YPG9_9BACL|nr:creatininase family protein [Paenibacillus sacheonensis]MBM7565143.1 creatinine amidohydrolase [Paenibacillus sacheonensis]NBC70077.1 creatininase family protein [Paenibacillus sacheonensis]
MSDQLPRSKFQWELMLPHEFRAAQAKLPVLFMPLGTVEWHGEHNALGLDSLKAHELLVRTAARAGGGVVHPPLYGGMGGLDKPATVIMEPEMAWENVMLRTWLEQYCYEFHRNGFKAIILLTGHYGHNQQIVVRETAVRMSERLRIPVFGSPEYWLALDEGYLGDHAGIGETSLLWDLHPDLVQIERIRQDPDYSVGGIIEAGSSPELGRRYADRIVERLSRLATDMVSWDDDMLDRYIDSERAIVNAQAKGWRNVGGWEFWTHIAGSEFVNYGQYLVEGKFEDIARIAREFGRLAIHRERG